MLDDGLALSVASAVALGTSSLLLAVASRWVGTVLATAATLVLALIPVAAVAAGVGVSFSPEGKRLALTINSATSPSDAYVIDLAAATLTRWTQSEVGGLDASRFVAPTLVRYPTFDQVDGTLVNYRLAAIWQPRRWFGLGAGYDVCTLDVDVDKDRFDGSLDWTYDGPQLFFSASF